MKTTIPCMDLNTAITKLIYDLKGDWSVSALASKIGVPRNRLAWIFDAYKVKKEENESRQSQSKESAIRNIESESWRARSMQRRLRWELAPLTKIADALGIYVSELIRAAEGIQAGLPAWFEYRIKMYTSKNHGSELMCVCFEAFGYHTYETFDMLKVSEDDINRRKSTWYPSTNHFHEYEIKELEFFITSLLNDERLEEFIIFHHRASSIEHTYRLLKDAVDDVTNKIRQKNVGLPNTERLPTSYLLLERDELISAIIKRYRSDGSYMMSMGSSGNITK